jgi:putative membrane protein
VVDGTALYPMPAVELSLSDIGWRAHPEVWVLLVGVVAIGWYVARVLQPKAVAAGLPAVTTAQKAWFGGALIGLWLSSDWPVHDVAEEHLYAVHMAQHLFISMLVPAMFLLAMPGWLFDLVLPGDSRARRWLATASRPLVAGITFNALTMFLHWSRIVQLSFDSGAFHYLAHLTIFLAGLLMWMPVIGPVEGWRIQPLAQCLYLFLMSIVPTVPGSWLVFAEGVVYRHYDTVDRLWGIDALTDQQGAGLIMKLVGGFFLWGVIVTIFGRWAADESHREEAARRARWKAEPAGRDGGGDRSDDRPGSASDGTSLTFEHVTEHFSRIPAPTEQVP